MPKKKYVVRLDKQERQDLTALVKKGKAPAYKIKHANILLKADIDGPNWSDEKVASAFCCHRRTVENVRRRLVTTGIEVALERKKRETPPTAKVIDGEAEAHLITLACGEAPNGRSSWTMELLAEKLVALNVVESVGRETVRKTLKKTNLSPTCASVG